MEIVPWHFSHVSECQWEKSVANKKTLIIVEAIRKWQQNQPCTPFNLSAGCRSVAFKYDNRQLNKIVNDELDDADLNSGRTVATYSID